MAQALDGKLLCTSSEVPRNDAAAAGRLQELFHGIPGVRDVHVDQQVLKLQMWEEGPQHGTVGADGTVQKKSGR